MVRLYGPRGDLKLLMGISQKYGQLTGDITTVDEHMGVKALQVRRGEGEARQAALHDMAKLFLFLNSDNVSDK